MSLNTKKVAIFVLNNFTNDSRVFKEAKTLQKNSYEVQVVALHNHPLKEKEKLEDIDVHRIKLSTRSLPKNKLIQLLKYFEFVFKVTKNYHNANILHCNDLSTLPIGILIKQVFNRKAKVVYDAHEYETETNGLKGASKKLYKQLEKHLIQYADHVITVSDSIANEYVRLYQIDKPSLILNTPHLMTKANNKNLFRKEFNITKEQHIFLYQGKLSKGRGIDILLQTFSKRKMGNNCIIFMGYGELKKDIKNVAEKSPYVFFHEAVPYNMILDYTASADYGISFIEDSCLSYRYCLPNKLFEYMMAEIPVICSDLPEMKKVVENYKLGVVAKKITQDGVYMAINKILQFQHDSKLPKTKQIFCWEAQEKKLIDIYKSLDKKIKHS